MDIPLLIETRLNILRAANGLSDDQNLSQVEELLQRYYQEQLPSGGHVAYLAFDGDMLAATGGVCFYQVLPTYHNPTGWKAYIINMYTVPAYRKQGLASHILELLVQESLRRDIDFIALETTSMGRPVYEKFGFVDMNAEMQLMNEAFDAHEKQREGLG